MAQIVETVTAATMAELRRKRDAVRDADVVELRLDGVTDCDVAGALAGRRQPVVITCRPVREGGRFEGDEGARLGILTRAIELGAEFVDVEWRADRSRLPRSERTRMIVSHHDFDGLPADLAQRVRAMRSEAGPGVVKVAVAVSSLTDCVRLREAVGRGSDQTVIGMGPAGVLTRVCPWLFDSAWTYGGEAAPGQLPAADLAGVYRVRTSGAGTAVFAVIGQPLGHSGSPAMHNAAMAATGLNAVFVPMETATTTDFLAAADAFGVEGASVTAPLKTGWAEDGVELDAGAAALGALNTLRRRDGRWEGRNFDAAAFIAPLLRRRVPLASRRVVVIGAGGAARAAVWALQRQGAHVEVSARRPEGATALAADLGASVLSWPPEATADVLVNATPVGTWPRVDESPVAASAVHAGLTYDLVYNPADTRLMREAREAGGAVIGGGEMLVAQARAQFEFWHGRRAPDAVMEGALAGFVERIAERRS